MRAASCAHGSNCGIGTAISSRKHAVRLLALFLLFTSCAPSSACPKCMIFFFFKSVTDGYCPSERNV